MRLALLTIALAGAASLRRTRRQDARRVYPELQHGNTYDRDFVHDDTAHPDEAIKVNIKESEEKLQDAKATMQALEGKLAAAKKTHEDAQRTYELHAAETSHAQEQIDKYNASLHGVDAIKAGIQSSEANLTAAMDRLNVTDTDATAAAEAIKASDEAFHEQNLELVEAKENVTAAEEVLAKFAKMVKAAESANVSLAEWNQKLNASQVGADELAAQVATAKAAYDDVHAHFQAAEARLSEAQKMFDVDKETYEQLVGPYTPPGGAKEDDSSESLWWDVLTGNAWTTDVDEAAPHLA